MRGSVRTLLAAALVATGTVVISSIGSGAAYADQTMTSSGPLSSILTTNDLNCAVNEVGDQAGEWFDGGA